MVQAARAGGYAVPALNTNGGSYDITRAALEAAQETRAPLILQVYEPNVAYRGFGFFAKQAEWLCDQLEIDVPVALQVDHAHSLDSARAAMDAGLTSVMIDASHLAFEENVRVSREVLELARGRGVSVEAEIGYVQGNEPPAGPRIGRVPVPVRPSARPAKTAVQEAVRFVAAVEVDMLAVSVGTAHGVYREQNEIDFQLLERLREEVSVPLVQHGTCGISPGDLSRLVECGMSKVNFGEPFRFNHIRYYHQLTDSMEHLWHPWRIMREIKDRLRADMIELIEALNAKGRAR
jgi:fructose-bisphosphate aldolase class II/tagatose 1,6-diphosphate aldolase GatY/KbaY